MTFADAMKAVIEEGRMVRQDLWPNGVTLVYIGNAAQKIGLFVMLPDERTGAATYVPYSVTAADVNADWRLA